MLPRVRRCCVGQGQSRVASRLDAARNTPGVRARPCHRGIAASGDVHAETRALNPNIEILLRTHNEEESELLRHEGVGKVFFSEEELAHGMANEALKRFAPQAGSRTADWRGAGAARLERR
jgi:hypothetical protein